MAHLIIKCVFFLTLLISNVAQPPTPVQSSMPTLFPSSMPTLFPSSVPTPVQSSMPTSIYSTNNWIAITVYTNSACSGPPQGQTAVPLGLCNAEYASGNGKNVTSYQTYFATSTGSGPSAFYTINVQNYSMDATCTTASGSPVRVFYAPIGQCSNNIVLNEVSSTSVPPLPTIYGIINTGYQTLNNCNSGTSHASSQNVWPLGYCDTFTYKGVVNSYMDISCSASGSTSYQYATGNCTGTPTYINNQAFGSNTKCKAEMCSNGGFCSDNSALFSNMTCNAPPSPVAIGWGLLTKQKLK